jgi:hypothetical protein
VCVCFFFFLRNSPPVGQGLLIHKVSRSHTTMRQSGACRRDLYLATHNTHNIQTSMPPVGFEPMFSVGKWPQTYALDHTATETGNYCVKKRNCDQLACTCNRLYVLRIIAVMGDLNSFSQVFLLKSLYYPQIIHITNVISLL